MVKRLLMLVLLTVIVSCNFHIEKRKYFKGYHIEVANAGRPHFQKEDQASIVPPDIKASSENQLEPASIAELAASSSLYSANSIIQDQKTGSGLQNNSKDSYTSVIQANTKKVNIPTDGKQQVQIKKKKSTHNGYLYGLAALIGLSIFALLRSFKLGVLKLSNWAAKNKYKTQILIGALQTAYAVLGVAIGKSLYAMGHDFSNTASYIFTGVFILGVTSLIVQKASSKIDLMRSFFRSKMSHLTIALASLMMMVVVGNKVGQGNPTNSPAGYVVEKIHNKFIAQEKANSNTPENFVPNEPFTKPGDGEVGALIALTIVLGVVLVILCCAVWCWALLTSPADPFIFVIAIAFTLLSAFLLTVCIRGVSRLAREKKAKTKPKVPHDDNPTF